MNQIEDVYSKLDGDMLDAAIRRRQKEFMKVAKRILPLYNSETLNQLGPDMKTYFDKIEGEMQDESNDRKGER